MYRSQMAAGIYNHLTNTNDATSAGTYTGAPDEPEGQPIINLNGQKIFEVLEEHGINIRENKTRQLTPKILDDADIAISMAEEPYIPDCLKNNNKVIWWDVKNPETNSREEAEKTYKQLEGLIEEFLRPRLKRSSTN